MSTQSLDTTTSPQESLSEKSMSPAACEWLDKYSFFNTEDDAAAAYVELRGLDAPGDDIKKCSGVFVLSVLFSGLSFSSVAGAIHTSHPQYVAEDCSQIGAPFTA